jgi:quercetin dioxygenase-like cupin family protein
MGGPSRALALVLTGFFSACAHATGANPAEAHLANPTSEMGRPVILTRGEGEHRLMQGQRSVYILVDSATTGSATLVAGLSDMIPGDSIPTHKHLGEEEMLFVHRGAVDVSLGEQTRRVGSGGTVFVPRGIWVGVRAIGADTATILFVFNAPGYEKCLRAQSSLPGERYAPPSAEVLQQVRRDCHQVRKSG